MTNPVGVAIVAKGRCVAMIVDRDQQHRSCRNPAHIDGYCRRHWRPWVKRVPTADPDKARP